MTPTKTRSVGIFRRNGRCDSVTNLLSMLLLVAALIVWAAEALVVSPRSVSSRLPSLPSIQTPRTSTSITTSTTLSMSSTPPPPRQPRRMLKKRRRKEKDNNNKRRFLSTPNSSKSPWNFNNKGDDDDYVMTEYRPLVSSVRRDMGEDYWIDPADLERERQREQMQKRKKQPGKNAIPKEKLWSEVKAPYQQNWIGYFSVFIAVLSMIVLKFPELLDTPTISYPDL